MIDVAKLQEELRKLEAKCRAQGALLAEYAEKLAAARKVNSELWFSLHGHKQKEAA